MRDKVPPLTSLHAYEAAARLGSFAAAAHELHLSQSAVSQRVRALEAHLGMPLFERLPRSVRLTEMGHAYLPAVRAAFDDLSVATMGLFGSTSAAQVTVRVQVSNASTWLASRLQGFFDANPHVDLRIVSAVWADAFPPDFVDLEIRHGSGNWPGFSAELPHHDEAVAICGPLHFERYGPVNGVGDLAARPRVHVLGFEDLWLRLFQEAGVSGSAVAERITLDTSVAAIGFVAAGDHCAMVPERFVRDALAAGSVLRVSDATVVMQQAHYVLHAHDRRAPSPEALSFVAWLRDLDPASPSAEA
jgi:LysR family glycine cleavage system transcriptional activator